MILSKEVSDILDKYKNTPEGKIPLYVYCIQWAIKNKIELPKHIFNPDKSHSKEFLELYSKWSEYAWSDSPY